MNRKTRLRVIQYVQFWRKRGEKSREENRTKEAAITVS